MTHPFTALLKDVTRQPSGSSDPHKVYLLEADVLAALAAAVPDDPAEAGKVAEECFAAVNGEGKRACDWADKPHRLVYDLCRTIRALLARIAAQEAQMKGLEEKNNGLADLFIKTTDRAKTAETALAAERAKTAKLVEAGEEAIDALEYSAVEIANLENVLSDYRENWRQAKDASVSLRAAIAEAGQ